MPGIRAVTALPLIPKGRTCYDEGVDLFRPFWIYQKRKEATCNPEHERQRP
jgi:hypothetical protein